MSRDAEQALIGGLLLDSGRYDDVADIVTSDDFQHREHRLAFRAIVALCQDGTAADVLTVSDRLEKSGELEAAGGLAYIGMLANNTPSAANVGSYARLVADAALERRLVAAAGQIAELAKGEDPAREKIDRAQGMLSALADASRGSGPALVRDVLPAVIDEIDRHHKAGSGIIGLSTGFVDLDEMTSGLQAGDLILIAGRPSMGKSTLSMQMAEHVASAGMTAAVFSLEMSAESLVMRTVASIGRTDFQRLRLGRLEDHEWANVTDAAVRLSSMALLVDQSPALTAMEIRARARRIKREHGLGLVVVDYIQLMRGEGESRNLEVANISAGLKALAKELAVPVIALSQLNRSLQNRNNKRPTLSDLRDSGSLEQDADVILFLYRDEIYDEQSSARGTAEVIIGKQRNGPTGTVRLVFQGHHCRFENYTGPAISTEAERPQRWRGGFDYE